MSVTEQKTVISKGLAIAAIMVTVCGLWAWWSTLTPMAERWGADPQYSHGFLVPLFALALLYLRRSELAFIEIQPSWWGLVLLVGGLGLFLASGLLYLEWFEQLALIPVAGGLALLLGGWSFFWWTLPAVAFLIFMIPLPFSLESALQSPLRYIGTVSSVYIMQTLGLPALAEGNIIVLGENRIGVAEACSGLRMVMVFLALSAAVAILSDRPIWERMLIFCSALPIALVVNIARIATTGTLYALNKSELARLVFHDLAGWLMMPCALLLLGLETWILRNLFIVESRQPMGMGIPSEAVHDDSRRR
ncbi:MAG: exosortase/archaeosortase family protein [Planctomycetaceae bacterium]|nr:exosortase/archaeosortase family protein [Planctomycetaceae bacterium]